VLSGTVGWRLTLSATTWLVTFLVLTGPSVSASSASHRGARHLYVSPRGSDKAPCTHSRPCRSIRHAVAVAHSGAEIDVAAGSYSGTVRLTKRLTLKGFRLPTINALGYGRGILIRGARAAGSVVRGFIVKNATYEGILALRTEWVKIVDNFVRHNDRGFSAPRLTGECKANGEPPGSGIAYGVEDQRAGGCGEAIHLASSSHSSVIGNRVTDNTGGIYLTDESGPAAHNLIVGNRVVRNVWDCGITLASHSRRAVTVTGRRRPYAGGIYDNTIAGNVAERNGVRLAGAGILVAAAYRGGAAYGNRIIGDIVSGNGLPGVTLHSHKWRQDLNGNVIDDNVIGHNAVSGPGDYDAGIHHTAGILVWSAKTRITRIHVSGNRIDRNYFGIWTRHVPPMKRSANHYSHVRVPLSQH
jgi:parallel beta-helix repeat protein